MTGDSRRVDRAFVEDALHELNKRAGALVAEASLLEECLCDVTGDARRPAELLIEDVERLRTFLHRLAAFLKAGRSGDADAGAERFDLVMLCREIAGGVAPAAGIIEIDAPSQAFVEAPVGPVAEAMALLVENGVTHGGGSVAVRVRPSERHVKVEIADRGPGMPPQLRDRPFEPFAASRSGFTRRGSGLGLALAHALLTSVGATLTYEPDVTGARFTFSLPR